MQPSQQPRILISAFNGHLFGMDPLSGQVLWEGEAPGAYPRMYINDAFTVVLGGGVLLCVDTMTGRLHWRTEVVGDTLLYPGGPFVFVADAGEVACLAIADGRLLWRQTFKGKGQGPVTLGVPGTVAQLDRGR